MGRKYTDAQLFLFCEDCQKVDTRNKGPCSRCSSIFMTPIFVWVEEAPLHD